jgi:hypothetical protein
MNIENNLFIKSFIKYQTFINTIIEYENENGICTVSQIELAKRLSLGQTTISKLIDRLNVEDNCIEMLSPGMYVVHYKNLLERGTLSCIWNLLCDTEKNYQLLFESDKKIAERYGYKLKTVQMFKAYAKTGNVK